MLWKKSLESYLDRKVTDERTKYFATEKISVESTDEEYEEFISKFFQAISMKILSSEYDETSKFYRYEVGQLEYIYIARTKDIEAMTISSDPNTAYPELLYVYITEGEAQLSGNFCYSKNNKYMLLSDPLDEKQFEYARVFSEIDD